MQNHKSINIYIYICIVLMQYRSEERFQKSPGYHCFFSLSEAITASIVMVDCLLFVFALL